jgi:hypothetical protein
VRADQVCGPLALAAVVLLTGCAQESRSSAGPDLVPASSPPPAAERPVVLQDPVIDEQVDAPRSWDAGRTDGDRSLLLSFTGGPPGDGRCGASYRATAEEDR